MDIRVGLGVDAHAFGEGIPLVLGGVTIDSPRGLVGHSDADVVAHAVIDAVLGAAALGDIGTLFPSGDARWSGASSLDLLARAWADVRSAGWELVNADAVLVGEEVLHRPRAEDIRRGDFGLGQRGQERLDRGVSLRKVTQEFGLGDEEPIVLHRAHPCCSNMRAYPLPPGSSDAPGRDRKTYTTTAGAIDHPCRPSQAGGRR